MKVYNCHYYNIIIIKIICYDTFQLHNNSNSFGSFILKELMAVDNCNAIYKQNYKYMLHRIFYMKSQLNICIKNKAVAINYANKYKI